MALPIPDKGVITYRDIKEKGLSLYVALKGNKSFVFRKYLNGKQKRIILGHFSDMTIEQARKVAKKLKGNIASGKIHIKKAKTFGDAFFGMSLINLMAVFSSAILETAFLA